MSFSVDKKGGDGQRGIFDGRLVNPLHGSVGRIELVSVTLAALSQIEVVRGDVLYVSRVYVSAVNVFFPIAMAPLDGAVVGMPRISYELLRKAGLTVAESFWPPCGLHLFQILDLQKDFAMPCHEALRMGYRHSPNQSPLEWRRRLILG